MDRPLPEAVRTCYRAGTTGSRDALSLTAYEMSAKHAEDLAALRDALARVQQTSELAGWPDVAGWSRANLALIGSGHWDGWVPFEML